MTDSRVCARPGCESSLSGMRSDAVWCSRACFMAAQRDAESSRSPHTVAALTQSERVLRLLRLRGSEGITQIDFDLPIVTDGGKPIKRVAARVLELREEGHQIESGERRQKCTVYRVQEATVEVPVVSAREVVEHPPAESDGDLGQLFATPVRQPEFDEIMVRPAVFDEEAA